MSEPFEHLHIAMRMLGVAIPEDFPPTEGYEGRIGEWLERFEDARTAAYMVIARRGCMPISEARHRWSDDDDLAAELAWDIKLANEAAERCPDCGVHPDSQIDPETGRFLEEPVFMAAEFHCDTCADAAKLSREVQARTKNNEGGADGVHIRIEPWDPAKLSEFDPEE